MSPHPWDLYLYPKKMLLSLTSPQSLLPHWGVSCSRVSTETPPDAFAPWQSCPQELPSDPVPGSPLILPQLSNPCRAVALLLVCLHPSPALSCDQLLL